MQLVAREPSSILEQIIGTEAPTLSQIEELIRSQANAELVAQLVQGLALEVVRDQALYVGTHQTFELYTLDVWRLDKKEAYRRISRAKAALDLAQGESLDISFASAPLLAPTHLDAISVAEPGDRRKIYEAVRAEVGEENLTAAAIRQAVTDHYMEAGKPLPPRRGRPPILPAAVAPVDEQPEPIAPELDAEVVPELKPVKIEPSKETPLPYIAERVSKLPIPSEPYGLIFIERSFTSGKFSHIADKLGEAAYLAKGGRLILISLLSKSYADHMEMDGAGFQITNSMVWDDEGELYAVNAYVRGSDQYLEKNPPDKLLLGDLGVVAGYLLEQFSRHSDRVLVASDSPAIAKAAISCGLPADLVGAE